MKNKVNNRILFNLYWLTSFAVIPFAIYLRNWAMEWEVPSTREILCADFPTCFRPFSFAIEDIFKMATHGLLGLIQIDQVTFLNVDLITGVLLRFLMMVPLLHFAYLKFAHSRATAFMIPLCFSSIIGSVPLAFFHPYFRVPLLIYDYGVIFVIGIILLQLKYRVRRTMFIPIVVIASLTFEHILIAIFFALSLYFVFCSRRVRVLIDILLVGSLSVIAPAALFYLAKMKFGTVSLADPNFYFLRNINNFPTIILGVSILIAWPILLSLLLRVVVVVDEKTFPNQSLVFLTLGFFATYFVGFFISSIATEGSRQLIMGQLLLFLGFFDLYMLLKGKIRYRV